MSFAAIASLVYGKKPFFLYEFLRGNDLWLFTSLSRQWVTVPDVFDLPNVFAEPDMFSRTWEPSPIKHGKITHSQRTAQTELPITFPQSDQFARLFLSPLGMDATRVRIFRSYENDPDAELVTIYRGRVLQATPKYKAGTIDLICGGGLGDLDRKGLSAVMQGPCRHVVYYGSCGLNLSDWTVNGTATGISGVTVTVPEAAASADGFYTSGLFEFAGAMEMIDAHVGDQLTLAAPVIGLADEIAASGSAAVGIMRGCDKSFATCRDAFANDDNHGGFPHMTISPFDGRSIR